MSGYDNYSDASPQTAVESSDSPSLPRWASGSFLYVLQPAALGRRLSQVGGTGENRLADKQPIPSTRRRRSAVAAWPACTSWGATPSNSHWSGSSPWLGNGQCRVADTGRACSNGAGRGWLLPNRAGGAIERRRHCRRRLSDRSRRPVCRCRGRRRQWIEHVADLVIAGKQ